MPAPPVTMAFVLAVGYYRIPAEGQTMPPDDQQVVFRIRETPDDSQSDIVFEVILSLSAQGTNGNSVGWRVDEAEFRAVDGTDVTVWRKVLPTVATTDGLWWATHADAANPALGEFASPPLLEGTATPDDSQEANLAYSLKATGTPFSTAGPPPVTHGVLTFRFTRVGETEPIEEGGNEAAEVSDHTEGGST